MDLYFAGQGQMAVDEFIATLNVNRLYSFLDGSRIVNRWIDFTKEYSSKLFLDSGAYSAHTKGKVINVDDYIARINELDWRLEIYAQLDTIPGEYGKPKTLQQLKEAPELSWENYLYMKERVATRDKLIPVFHQGEDFKHLHRMLEYLHEEDGEHIKYIGISPANDVVTPYKDRWFAQVFNIIKNSSNPNVKTHAFGMTSKTMLEKYPFTSADSTTWLMHARFGNLHFGNQVITVSDRKLDDPLFYKNFGAELTQAFENKVKERGLDLDMMMTSSSYRCRWEVLELLDWLKTYKYRGSQKFQKRLF